MCKIRMLGLDKKMCGQMNVMFAVCVCVCGSMGGVYCIHYCRGKDCMDDTAPQYPPEKENECLMTRL